MSLIRNRVGTVLPVYLSINLNIIDAGQAPGVSEPAVGRLDDARDDRSPARDEGLNLVGAGVTGLAPDVRRRWRTDCTLCGPGGL